MSMNRIVLTLAVAATLVGLTGCCPNDRKDFKWAESQTLASPDGHLELTVGLLEDGVPAYALTKDGKPVVSISRLGFSLINGENLQDGFTLAAAQRDSLDETWEPVWGEEDSIRNHYNELLITFEQTPEEVREAQSGVSVTDPEYTGDLGNASGKGAVMQIRFRLYDDGLGFRYEFPQKNKLTYFQIKEELTEFAMTGDHTAWWELLERWRGMERRAPHRRLQGRKRRHHGRGNN